MAEAEARSEASDIDEASWARIGPQGPSPAAYFDARMDRLREAFLACRL